MRIAFISRGNDPYVNARAKYLLRQRHEVYYFVLPSGRDATIPNGVMYVHMKPSILRNIKLLRIFSHVYSVRCFTRKYRLDILHIINMGLSKHAMFSKCKKVVLENEGSDVLLNPHFDRILKRKYRIYYHFADAVIQDSKISQDAGIRYGAPKRNNEIIEIGVDFTKFNLDVKQNVARQRLNIRADQKFVFCSRSFRKRYNIDTIIETIPNVRSKFPDVKYIFCCPCEDIGENYLRLIDRLSVRDSVIFTGYLDHEKEMPFFVKDADVVVSVPSSDSSPFSVYEAMACGTPVIISELPWYHEKFEKDRDLVAVPVRNVEKLATAILDILEGRKTLDLASAYKKVFEHINYETENQKLEALYERILEK